MHKHKDNLNVLCLVICIVCMKEMMIIKFYEYWFIRYSIVNIMITPHNASIFMYPIIKILLGCQPAKTEPNKLSSHLKVFVQTNSLQRRSCA